MADDTGVVGPMLGEDPAPTKWQLRKRHKATLPAYEQLNEQRRMCVDYYVMDPTSFRNAVLSAGYSKRSIDSKSHKLYHEPLMQAAIAEQMNEKMERTQITADRVLHELAVIAFGDLRNYDIDPKTGTISLPPGVPEYVMRAVSSIKFITTIDENGTERRTLEFKLWDKLGALRMMGQHLAMFTDKLTVGGEIDVRQKWSIGGQEIVF